MLLGLPLRRSLNLPFAVVCALLFGAVGATGSGGHEPEAAGSGSVQLVAAGSIGILADEGREEKQPRWGIHDQLEVVAQRGAVAETSSELLHASLYWIWQQRPPSNLYLLDPMASGNVLEAAGSSP
uniref:Uncharacterized protein n=1 Tax=Oryza meridionalis TaxID=40149 RepID=A0A0E0F477_9ORYZ